MCLLVADTPLCEALSVGPAAESALRQSVEFIERDNAVFQFLFERRKT